MAWWSSVKFKAFTGDRGGRGSSVKVNDPAVCKLNVAVRVMLAFIVSIQVSATLQPPPLQPAKADPAAGVAVRVTEVLLS